MLNDIATVMWKEIKELPYLRGGFRGGKFGMLIFVFVFGVYMPLQTGREWVTSPLVLAYWAWVPFLLVSSVIADSFAGERERHTLETLLASRLSDRAILFGKIAAGIAYGWGLTMGCILIGLIAVNIVHGKGELLLFPANIGLGVLSLTFLIAMLASGLGVLISLRSATVRQAQQTFSIAFFLLFIPVFALPMLPPEWQARLVSGLMQADVNTILLGAVGLLLLLNAALVLAALKRFQRAKLILD